MGSQKPVSLEAHPNRVIGNTKMSCHLLERPSSFQQRLGCDDSVCAVLRSRPFCTDSSFWPVFTHALKHRLRRLKGCAEVGAYFCERLPSTAHLNGDGRINFIIENSTATDVQFVGNRVSVVFLRRHPFEIFTPIINRVSIFMVDLVASIATLTENACHQPMHRNAFFRGAVKGNHKAVLPLSHVSRGESLERLENTNRADSSEIANFIPMVRRHLLASAAPFFNFFHHEVNISYREV